MYDCLALVREARGAANVERRRLDAGKTGAKGNKTKVKGKTAKRRDVRPIGRKQLRKQAKALLVNKRIAFASHLPVC